MNYIKHLTGFFEKVAMDCDLNPTHISLYMAIFQQWNHNRFINPINVTRNELMRISKIASTATYHKCIKELIEKGYINYNPSFSPFSGTTIEIINLDYLTKPILKKDIIKLRTSSKNNLFNNQVIEQVNEQVAKQVNEQALNRLHNENYIYNNNYTNKKIKTNVSNVLKGQAHKKNEEILLNFDDFANNPQRENSKKKLRQKKGLDPSKNIPPEIEMVHAFFLEKNASEQEAEKFFNYFQSNGWLVGGKSKMKDWKAATRNWLLNAEKFKPSSHQPQPNNLSTSNNKNYEEPL